MDITLLNFSEISRRLKISKPYAYFLMTGARRSEKRLAQIADLLRMDVAELKAQIERNRAKEERHAGGHARAHTPTRGNRIHHRQTSACR